MPKAQIQSIIWLLFDGHLKFDYESQLTEFWPRNFSAISETMFKIYESQNRTNADVEVFYLSQGLADLLKRFSSNDIITEAIQSFLHILSTNQGTSNIYPHLDKIGLTQGTEPFRTWFSRGFAGVLNTPALEKIWDKVIGGSLKILVFAAVALIESCKMALLTCQTSQEAVRCLTAVSCEIKLILMLSPTYKNQQSYFQYLSTISLYEMKLKLHITLQFCLNLVLTTQAKARDQNC
jgi:hypothetical protein